MGGDLPKIKGVLWWCATHESPYQGKEPHGENCIVVKRLITEMPDRSIKWQEADDDERG